MFDNQPFAVADGAGAIAFAGPATNYADGVNLTKNTAALGLIVVVTGVPDGTITVDLQTSDIDAAVLGDWTDCPSSKIVIQPGAAGNFTLAASDPVLDAVRARIVYTGAAAITVAIQWLASTLPTAR